MLSHSRRTLASGGRATVRPSSGAAATTTPPPVGCFGAVRVGEVDGMPSLLSRRNIGAGDVVFRFTGALLDRNQGDRCLQVGRDRWVTPAPGEGEPPWVFLNHSFAPTVRVSHPRAGSGTAAPVLAAIANVDLAEDAELTIDYTLHEYVMLGEGFVCRETGRAVRGFRYLTDEEQEAAVAKAAEHIQLMHAENRRSLER